MPRGRKRGRKPGSRNAGFVGKLTGMIDDLKKQYNTHHTAMRTLEDIFAKIGIPTGHASAAAAAPTRGRPGRKPGRPPGSAAAAGAGKGRRRRGRFGTSGPDTVLAFVKEGGARGRTSGEINKHWKSEGRSGDAYITLGMLTKSKRLKKQKIQGERGSRYSVG